MKNKVNKVTQPKLAKAVSIALKDRRTDKVSKTAVGSLSFQAPSRPKFTLKYSEKDRNHYSY